jgi:hypothetical protein
MCTASMLVTDITRASTGLSPVTQVLSAQQERLAASSSLKKSISSIISTPEFFHSILHSQWCDSKEFRRDASMDQILATISSV